jgi:hypothetical protein
MAHCLFSLQRKTFWWPLEVIVFCDIVWGLSGLKVNCSLQRTIFGMEKVMKRCDINTLSMALQPFGPWPLFQFLNLYTVGRTPWTGHHPFARPLPTHRTTQTQNKRTQTSIPWVGFEPTISVFERAKTVHALDCTATVIGPWLHWKQLNNRFLLHFYTRTQCWLYPCLMSILSMLSRDTCAPLS